MVLPLFFALAHAQETSTIELYGEEFPVSESVTYVMDRSGSMSWGSSSYSPPGNPVQEGAEHELVASIAGLSEPFRFNVLSYECSVYSLWSAPQPADDAKVSEAIDWIEALPPVLELGSGRGAVQALTSDPEQIIVLTDGQPNCPYQWKTHLEAVAASGRKVSTIGIGDYGSFAQFLASIADRSGGIYLHVE